MKTLYIDCTNGICSDMVLDALLDMGADLDCEEKHELEHMLEIDHDHDHHCCDNHDHNCCGGHDHGDDHDHIHEHAKHSHEHRSYQDIRTLIKKAPIGDAAKEIAGNIYHAIAKAEAKVHEATLENVHFHEVGRNKAVMNIISIAMCIEQIVPDKIICSTIHDGKGFIECSHGTIPVPVPAVMAMRENCDYTFETDDIQTEMVTPSGLAILIGMGAVCSEKPEGSIISKGIGRGTRDTGRGGMEIYLIEGEQKEC